MTTFSTLEQMTVAARPGRPSHLSSGPRGTPTPPANPQSPRVPPTRARQPRSAFPTGVCGNPRPRRPDTQRNVTCPRRGRLPRGVERTAQRPSHAFPARPCLLLAPRPEATPDLSSDAGRVRHSRSVTQAVSSLASTPALGTGPVSGPRVPVTGSETSWPEEIGRGLDRQKVKTETPRSRNRREPITRRTPRRRRDRPRRPRCACFSSLRRRGADTTCFGLEGQPSSATSHRM